MRKSLYPPESICRPLPKNFNQDSLSLFRLNEFESWEVYYDVIDKVTVNSELFVKKFIKILPISFGDRWQDAKYNRPLYLAKTTLKDLLRVSRPVPEVLWVLDQFSTGGYYHWLTEILPRIWASQKYGVDKEIPLYFPKYFFTKWQFGEELLAPFKLNIQTYTSRDLIKISKMHFISQVGGPLAFQSIPLKGTRDLLLENFFDLNYEYENSKIYISRNRGNKRLIINEKELLPIIVAAGFQVIYAEEMSIKDQINVFARANTILSIHGAGLTNMIFMREAGTVIEIRNKSEDHMVNCFLALSDTMNHEYRYILGDMVPQVGEHREIDYSIRVSTSELEEALNFVER